MKIKIKHGNICNCPELLDIYTFSYLTVLEKNILHEKYKSKHYNIKEQMATLDAT